MPNNDYANEPNQSRSEEIIQSILDNTEYGEEPRSRIEYLLIELKNAIEGGGGGGSVTSYSSLTEKPKIDNHTLQAGNNSSSDLGLQTKLTFDSAPIENSTNPVTSGGVYTALGTKANSSDVYNKSAVDTALGAKADKSTTYTKTEVDTALNSKQNTISDLSTIRSGAALGATAVQPVSGKGLSTNDYTTAEKEKLAGIEAQANKTTVDSALSGTSANPVQNKVVKSALDSKQTSLTTAQLDAVNSGITPADVEQITTNKNNISTLEHMNGAKNLYRFEDLGATTGSGSGVTLTDNGDGTFSATGTASGANYARYLLKQAPIKAGNYIISGISGGALTTYRLRVGTGSGDAYIVNLEDDYAQFTIANDTTITVQFVVNSGVTVTNLSVKPMITTKAMYEAGFTDYQPYTMSNAEITAWILAHS